MQAFATTNKTTDYTALVNDLAVYFQIRDDFINLVDEEYMKSKSFCEDLTEGKFSFPVIHCIKSFPDDHRLSSILKQRTEDTDVKRYAQKIMIESGSLEYTRTKCKALKQDILDEIQKLGGNPPLEKVLEALDVQIQEVKTMEAWDQENFSIAMLHNSTSLSRTSIPPIVQRTTRLEIYRLPH